METKFVEPVPKNYIWTVYLRDGRKAKVIAYTYVTCDADQAVEFYDKHDAVSGAFMMTDINGFARGKEVK